MCVQLLASHGLGHTRVFCPWNSPGKNTGVGWHFLLQGIFLTQGVRPESPALWADSLPSEALAQFTNLPNLCYMFLHLLGSHRSSRNHLLQIVFMLQKIKLGFTVVLTCPSVQRQSVMELRKTQESSEVLFYSIYNLVSVVLILGSGEMGFPGSSAGKESACNAGDPSSIPELERSPGGGHGNPHQYSCLENPMDRGAWPATYSPWGGKSQTWLSTAQRSGETEVGREWSRK